MKSSRYIPALLALSFTAGAACIPLAATAQSAGTGAAGGTGSAAGSNAGAGTTGNGTNGVAGTTGAGTAGTGAASGNVGGINAGQNNGTTGINGTASPSGTATDGTPAGTDGSASSTASPNANGTNNATGQNTNGIGSPTGQNNNAGNSPGTSSSPSGTGTPSGQTGTAAPGNGRASGNLLPQGTAAPQVYDLATAIAAALRSSSDLQIAARNVEIDRRRADEFAAAGRPSLGASASATRFDQATAVRIGPGPAVEVLGKHTEQLSINLGERLDIAGQIRASSSQAFLQSTADQYVYDSIRNARILRAKSIYFNLLRAQHQVQVAQAALQTAQRQLLDARNLNAGQVGQKIDVYRAATQVATQQQSVTAAQNNERIAEQNFNDLVGQPLTVRTQVQDVPGASVGTAIVDTTAVGTDTRLSFTPFTVPPAQLSSIDVDRSLQTALSLRPELLVDAVNIRVAQAGITLARVGLAPTLALNASGNYFPTTSFQTPRQRTAAVTATLNVPLYDGGATRDRVEEARLRVQNAQTQLSSDQSGIALDVRQSYLNLITAARQIDAANTALQQAIAARQLAQIRYEGQVGLYLEVTDAQAALVQAENSQVNAVYDYLVAQAQFQNAVGQPQTQ